jgi:predicted esterase
MATSLTRSLCLVAVLLRANAATLAAAPPVSDALSELQAFLDSPAESRGELSEQDFATVPLPKDAVEQAIEQLWANRSEQLRAARAAEMKARKVSLDKLEMPFWYKVFGEKPEGGRSLFISMHGGGGAPARVNDGQWENQKRLYDPEEGVYLVPRAPTNSWNLWHQGHIDEFFARLIENMILFEDVNPDRVYILGYSAGGDGVYQLAPRMSDRFAGAAMMAGHPNETSPEGLRNIPFALHVGSNDAGYSRNKIAKDWETKLAELHKEDPDGYPHWVKVYEGKGHWLDREDRATIPWMAKNNRRTFPKKIIWKQDDVTHNRFYWLCVDDEHKAARTTVIAILDGQSIDLQSPEVKRISVRLNDEMLDLDKPVKITSGGKLLFEGNVNRSVAILDKTLNERGDPKCVFSAEITVDLLARQQAE